MSFFEEGAAGESYRIQRDLLDRINVKNHIESLWELFEPFAEKEFKERSKLEGEFSQRMWELYVGATLIFHEKNLQKKTAEGPDHLLSEGISKVWIEDIAINLGDGDDAVPPLVSANVRMGERPSLQSIPEDQMILRITSGLKEKFEKYEKYCEKSVIGDSEPYVIALNSGMCLLSSVGRMPLVLKAVFALGNQYISVDPEDGNVSESGWTIRDSITKKNSSVVPMDFFIDSKQAGVSAVIYCDNNICSIPTRLGDDIFIVHNPNAKNPLPRGFFPFGIEYFVDKGILKHVNLTNRI